MSGRGRSRLAYSSDPRQRPVCRHCGAELGSCRCLEKRQEAVPDAIVAKLRIEKKGRGGKTVTVVHGLPRNEAFLRDLAKELKSACGSGGTVSGETVEIQGDHRDRLRQLLAGKPGWTVKG